MSEIMECAHCHKPTTMRCSRCKLLLLCSRECLKAVWKTHKPDCTAIQRGRAASVNAGENPETLASIPLTMPMAEYAELYGPTNAVRERHAATEKRLKSGDRTLPTADKVRFFADMLQVVDTSGNEHEHRSLVHKMALNRQYNNIYRDAVERLQSHELTALNGEMQRRRIGAFFKQHG